MQKIRLPPGAIDAHCHLADSRLHGHLDEILARADANGVSVYLQAGIGPDDWRAQRSLMVRFPNRILPCFGLHPYFVSGHDSVTCEAAMRELEDILDESVGAGEMGLDFRPQFETAARARQTEFFARQLALASQKRKPVILHIVRAHEEAIALIKANGPLARGGIVHAFRSSPQLAKRYLDLGLYISVGGPVRQRHARPLEEAIRSTIPADRLLLESDSPDQPPPELGGQINEPWTIRLVAERVAEIKGTSSDVIIDQSRRNFTALFQEELEG